MNPVLHWLKQSFANRPDSEHVQALIRFAVLAVVLVYLVVIVGARQTPPDGFVDVLGMVALAFTIGSALVAWIIVSPGVSACSPITGLSRLPWSAWASRWRGFTYC